jgi:SAM-dependent methyltransferase
MGGHGDDDTRAPEGEGSLLRWLAATPGQELVERECRCVEDLLVDLFGYYLVQVGWGRAFAGPIGHSRIRHHLTIEPYFPGLGAQGTLIGYPEALPVASCSVDAVFLPHTLELADDPRQVLREAERVLIPEGRVVLLGFNPWGSWGLWRLVRRRSEVFPWCGRFLGPRRVLDWLALLGFRIEVQRPIMWLPPLRQASLLRQLGRLEHLGERWLPLLSASYAIRAVKRVSTLTPLEPLRKRNTHLLPGRAVEPTVRGGSGV